MPQTLQTLAVVVASVLGIIGLVAYAVARFRIDKATITKELKDELIATLEADGERDTRRIEALEKDLAVATERIKTLERENQTLRPLIAAKADWQALKDLSDRQHREVMAVLSAIKEALTSG